MGLTISCAECKRIAVNGSIHHEAGCTVNLQQHTRSEDYIRYPATILKFDTPEEQAEWLRKLKGSQANTVPLRELAQPPKPTKPNDEEDDVFGFLLGENSLNGFNFGDEQSGVPKYWWRSNLRKAITKREHLAELRGALTALKHLDSIPENRFKYTLDEMHREIHKGITSAQQQLEEANT